MTNTPAHQAAIAGGLAHFAGLPRIELDGDNAVVTSYLQILTPHPTAEAHEVPNHGVSKGFRVHRVAANAGSSSAPRRLEDQAAHRAHDRRLGASPRNPARRTEVIRGEPLETVVPFHDPELTAWRLHLRRRIGFRFFRRLRDSSPA